MNNEDIYLLTIEDAAEKLSIGRTKMYSLVKAKVIASVRIGKSRRITPEALKNFVKSLSNDREGFNDTC